MNKVELQRRELQKDHHGSKWGKAGYSLKMKGRVRALERGWKRLRKVAVGNVKGTQHEQVQK